MPPWTNPAEFASTMPIQRIRAERDADAGLGSSRLHSAIVCPVEGRRTRAPLSAGSPSAAAARGWSRGGRRWPPTRPSATAARLLGAAGAGVRRPGRADRDRRPGARGERRQPHRADVHRRPLGRLALRRASPRGLANQPDRRPRATTGSAARRLHHRRQPLRAAANKPTPDERDNCLPYLVAELRAARAGAGDRRARLVRLGRGAAGAPRGRGRDPAPKPRFGHGAEARVGAYTLLGCFHPSQQNTFTGKLTEPMLDAVFARARELAKLGTSR